MKKLIVGLLMAALSGVGLVGVTGGAAHAVTCPYTGCVRTHTYIVKKPKTVALGESAKICAKVVTAGDRVPVGRVTATVRLQGSVQPVYTHTKKVQQPRTCFVTKPLSKPGVYTVFFYFTAKRGSVFTDSISRSRVMNVPGA